MSEFGGLLRCAIDRDRDFAQKTAGEARGKREHVRRIVVAEELVVEAPKLPIIGKQALEATAPGDFRYQFFGECAEFDTWQSLSRATIEDYRAIR
jgi:hypothetical protein